MNGVANSTGFDLHPSVICPPTSKLTNLQKFQTYVEENLNHHFDDYWKFHEWSVENFPTFWGYIWKYFDVIHSKPPVEVFDKKRGFCNMEWFSGARLNYAENLLRYRDSHLAIVATNEEGTTEEITYSQLYDEVAIYASALRAFGVKKGDTIACFMSNRKEAIMAFLATASIGAIWSGSLPDFGPRPVVQRLSQIYPKLLFTIDRFVCEGTEVDLLSKLVEIQQGLPTLEKIIILSTKEDRGNISHIPKSCWLDDFLALSPSNPELQFEQLPFDHPLTISYTSGTTGKPKALIHSGGSYLTNVKDLSLHHNCTREDRILHISPCGWISWNLFTNALHLGLTVCLYEGAPHFLTPTSFWDVVEDFSITYIFLPASILEEFRKKAYLPTPKHTLKKLRFIGVSCSPIKAQLYDFTRDSIILPKNPEMFLASVYGCTEAMGFLLGVNFSLPLLRGEIQCFSLGVDTRCLDEEGNHTVGKRGDLVVANPLPSLPLRIYNDDENGNRLVSSYLTLHPGNWSVNDECWINPVTRGFIILGRSDETMKSNGERFNSSDIYSVIDIIPEIDDSLCVSQTNDKMDERVILFVKTSPGSKFSRTVEEKIKNVISNSLTPDFVPSIILEAPEIPYNYSGKKMELLVKKILSQKAAPNKEVLVNPSSIDFYENIPELKNF